MKKSVTRHRARRQLKRARRETGSLRGIVERLFREFVRDIGEDEYERFLASVRYHPGPGVPS